MTRRRLILLILVVAIVATSIGGNTGQQRVAQSTPVVTERYYDSYDECMADPAALYCEETP